VKAASSIEHQTPIPKAGLQQNAIERLKNADLMLQKAGGNFQ